MPSHKTIESLILPHPALTQSCAAVSYWGPWVLGLSSALEGLGGLDGCTHEGQNRVEGNLGKMLLEGPRDYSVRHT